MIRILLTNINGHVNIRAVDIVCFYGFGIIIFGEYVREAGHAG